MGIKFLLFKLYYSFDNYLILSIGTFTDYTDIFVDKVINTIKELDSFNKKIVDTEFNIFANFIVSLLDLKTTIKYVIKKYFLLTKNTFITI